MHNSLILQVRLTSDNKENQHTAVLINFSIKKLDGVAPLVTDPPRAKSTSVCNVITQLDCVEHLGSMNKIPIEMDISVMLRSHS